MLAEKNKYRHLFAICGLFITIVFVVGLLIEVNSGRTARNQINMEDGWTFVRNGEVLYEDAKLADMTFDVTQIGEVITLSTVLPQSSEYATLRIWMCHSAIDAYVGDELIYSSGHKAVEEYKMVGSGFYFIELPVGYAGKLLTLTFTVGESDAFAGIEPIYIESSNTIFTSFLHEKFVFIIIGNFLMIFGLAGLVMGSFFLFYVKEFQRLIYVFMASAFMGVWTLCNNGIAQLFGHNYVFAQALEFAMLFLTPVPLLAFLLDITKEVKWLNKSVTVMLYVFLAFNLVTFVGAGYELFHFQQALKVYHFLIVLMIFITLVIVIMCSTQKDSSKRAVAIGGGFMILGASADILSFYLRKYALINFIYIDYGAVIGELILFICLFASYFVSVMQQVVSGTETELLKKMAYNDILTGLNNRLRFEQLMDEMDAGHRDFAILYFDLNGLKTMNDVNGHEAGDALLKEFAKCLEEVFGGDGEVARMGGDEFAAILPNVSKERVLYLAQSLQKYMKNHNAKSNIRLDTAMGIAFHYEVPNGTSREVFKLADGRMYDMKRKMKSMRKNS